MNPNEIFNQLTRSNNGTNRLKAMIGGNNFACSGKEGYVSFRFACKSKNKANYMKITLTADDLYTVEFGYIRGMKYFERSKTKGIYNSDLFEYFEYQTGLYLKF